MRRMIRCTQKINERFQTGNRKSEQLIISYMESVSHCKREKNSSLNYYINGNSSINQYAWIAKLIQFTRIAMKIITKSTKVQGSTRCGLVTLDHFTVHWDRIIHIEMIICLCQIHRHDWKFQSSIRNYIKNINSHDYLLSIEPSTSLKIAEKLEGFSL